MPKNDSQGNATRFVFQINVIVISFVNNIREALFSLNYCYIYIFTVLLDYTRHDYVTIKGV